MPYIESGLRVKVSKDDDACDARSTCDVRARSTYVGDLSLAK